jgi:hypothetical protein
MLIAEPFGFERRYAGAQTFAIPRDQNAPLCPTGKSARPGDFVCRVLFSVFPKIFHFAHTPNHF